MAGAQPAKAGCVTDIDVGSSAWLGDGDVDEMERNDLLAKRGSTKRRRGSRMAGKPAMPPTRPRDFSRRTSGKSAKNTFLVAPELAGKSEANRVIADTGKAEQLNSLWKTGIIASMKNA